jgi:hypothetical protein
LSERRREGMPQKVRVNGIEIAYEDEGPRDGPVVVERRRQPAMLTKRLR